MKTPEPAARAGLRVSAELEERLVALRRDLHKHPELSFHEQRSASVLTDFLTALDLASITRVAGTGIVARVAGRNPDAPVVAIRGAIDALPIHEATGLSFASVNAAASVHVRFGTPALAIIALAVWSALLAVSGTFEQLLTYVVFAGWIFYGLGATSVFVYRRRPPEAIRPFRTPGYPVTPVLFVASAGMLVLSTLVAQPIRGAVGLGAVLLGMPTFHMWRARRRRAPVRPVAEPSPER